MADNEEWPLSIEELELAKQLIYDKISILEVMQRYSRRISECWHADFTHRCTCPYHKSGAERTPSMWISEKTKTFKCFGCDISGDVFDLIQLLEGTPWHLVVKELLGASSINTDEVDFTTMSNEVVRYDLVYSTNMELSTTLRDYLATFFNTDGYPAEKSWVDSVFVRIDDRLANLSDSDIEQVRSFKFQIFSEIERRKKLVARNK